MVSYKKSVQQVHIFEREDVFHYTLIDCIFKKPTQKTYAWLMFAARTLLASLVVYPLKEKFFQIIVGSDDSFWQNISYLNS